jgi:hypothetical protein
MLEYLNETQKKTGLSAAYNIQDKMNAVMTELNKEHSYKCYLNEKLDSIYWDVKVLLNMCNQENEETNENN